MKKQLNNNQQTIIKNSVALCWLNDHDIILYKKGKIVQVDLEKHLESVLLTIPLTKKETILSLTRITRRLFRLYPYSPVFIEKNNELLFSFNGYFCSLNLITKNFCRETRLDHGARRVLSICPCKNGDVYYGEYPTKYDGLPVSIYVRREKKHIKVFSFSPNEIRHIHLLKEYKNDLFCFTGDETHQIKIVRFKDKNFVSAPDFISGLNQTFRTCVASFHSDSIYYLTDTPYFENHLSNINIETRDLNNMSSIEGSVIYGLDSEKELYFSTSVEKNLLKIGNDNKVIKIDGKNGGIRSNFAFVYRFGFDDLSLNKLFCLKKDSLSIKAFGIGTFMFTGNSSTSYVAFSSSGLKKDETTFILNKEYLLK